MNFKIKDYNRTCSRSTAVQLHYNVQVSRSFTIVWHQWQPCTHTYTHTHTHTHTTHTHTHTHHTKTLWPPPPPTHTHTHTHTTIIFICWSMIVTQWHCDSIRILLNTRESIGGMNFCYWTEVKCVRIFVCHIFVPSVCVCVCVCVWVCVSCVCVCCERVHVYVYVYVFCNSYFCNGAEWSKDRTQVTESIKWRPQQAYGSNQFLLVQPQTVFSTHKIITLTHR